jgi:glycosyltransferase involved in cell wall biosynthesis
MAPVDSGIAKHPFILSADVIYLHWIQGGFLSYADIKSIAQLGKPVFCFTHDMWWITGGCHYAFNCELYKTGCNNCQMHKHFNKIFTNRQLEKKKELYEQYSNIHFIAPSNWMKECINQSFALGKNRCEVIPNVVPEKDFKYIDKSIARDYFNLPHEKIIISFGTADNKNKVKGIIYLIDALKQIKNDNLLLCVYGSEYDDYLVRQLSLPIRFLGRISKASEVAMANAASDLFISPTLAESFGLTLLENIKCGTPVVSTNVTAVPEIIHDHINGYLVDPQNSNQIVNAIQDFIDNPIVLDGSFDNVFKDEIILNKHIDSIKRVLNCNLI